MAKVFVLADQYGGHTIYGNELTANGADIEPGLMVTLDTNGRQVTLSAGSGSKPFGFAYGDRTPAIYAPTSKLFADSEPLNVVTGHGYALVSADFFSSGSLPTEAAYRTLFAGAGGKLDDTGTFQVARLIDVKTWTSPDDGTGISENVALIQYDFQDLA